MSRSNPTARVALGALVAGVLLAAAAYALAFMPGGAPVWAAWPMVAAIALLMGGFMVLGAARPGRRLGALAWVIAAAALMVVAGFGLALRLPAETGADTVLWLGLPPRAALVAYVVGVLPSLVLPLAYALTFERLTLDEADLARVRAASRDDGLPRG